MDHSLTFFARCIALTSLASLALACSGPDAALQQAQGKKEPPAAGSSAPEARPSKPSSHLSRRSAESGSTRGGGHPSAGMERPERLRRPPIGSVKDIAEPPGATPIESEVDLPDSPPEAANLGSAPMAVISSQLSVDEVVAHYTKERPDLRVGDNGKGGKSLMIRVKEGWLTVIVWSHQGRTMVVRRLLSTDQPAQ